eukprot:m.32534 g.32534  ORF g.32534 m.32534 type:complete len:436 (+) comp4897_c0_seq2:247-1554(+)
MATVRMHSDNHDGGQLPRHRGHGHDQLRQPQTRAPADFLAHTEELLDPTQVIQHGSTNSHAAYDHRAFHGRTRGCAHIEAHGQGGLVYLDKPQREADMQREREANRVKVKVGGLEQELNGRGDFRAPKANAPADFFFGAQTRDPRREKRGEVRPLSERFADPQEYARIQQEREREVMEFRKEQVSQIEARAAERAAQRKISRQRAQDAEREAMYGVRGPKSEDERARAARINERHRERHAQDVQSDPYRCMEGKRERRAVVLLDPVVGGASGYDYHQKWYQRDRASQAAVLGTRASESRFENPSPSGAQQSNSIVDTHMRKDGNMFNNHPVRHDGAGSPDARRRGEVTRGKHNFDRAVNEDEWVHRNVGNNHPHPRRLQDFDSREQRHIESLPPQPYENPTRDIEKRQYMEARGLGFIEKNPEFIQGVRRASERW